MVNISLTASMRSNLLSLQSIASQQDLVQNRLATGLKVSSAIDNPSSYYTAQSLNNRASDLTQLLDSMSQGIQTLKAVSETITSVSKFLEQAKAVANQAMENTQPIVARVSSEADLQAALASDMRGLIVIDRDIVMSTNSNIVLKDGQSLVGAKYLDKTARQTSISFNFVGEAKNSIEVGNSSIVSDLDLSVVTDKRGNKGVVYAQGKTGVILQQLSITMDTNTTDLYNSVSFSGIIADNTELNGYINVKDIGVVSNTTTGGNYSTHGISGNIKINNNAVVNIITNGYDGRGLNSGKISLYGNSQLNIKTNSLSGHAVMGAVININDNSKFNINSSGYITSSVTININDNGHLNTKGKSLGFVYSRLNILSKKAMVNLESNSSLFYSNEAINKFTEISMVTGAKISLMTGTFTSKTSLNYSLKTGNNIFNSISGDKATEFETIIGPAVIFPAEYNDKFADFDKYMTDSMNKTVEDKKDIVKESYQYNSILNQFDMIIKDSSYKGVNLLLGQSLKVNFNEDRSSKLDITGVNASTIGLGLNDASWKNQNNVEASISELDSAISDLRQYASEFGNYYSIVSNREEFTNNLVNVLTEGADKLTLADMNQESANMLALQTAQSLAINSLSLASQASQSILKLF